MFTPRKDGGGSRVGIKQNGVLGEQVVDVPTAYNDGNQHLATVTVDDATDTVVYYIDGVQIGQVSLSGTNLTGIEAVNNFLGRSQFGVDPGFIGSMNQFAIYDRALSPSDVLDNYTVGPISGSLAPIGFTQSTPGSATMVLEGDQTLVFPIGTLVAATPLLSNTTVGSPTFSTVQAIAFDANTNRSTITLAGPTAAGTTAGALTLAEAIRPEFRLTQFVGVNFSNLNLKEGGGLFVDVVEGADANLDGVLFPNVGILLTDGLLAYSTIGIRRELAATVLLGTKNSASVDGRMFVEFATPESLIYVGPQNRATSKNSKFQLTGGPAAFGAGVVVNQAFDGVVNLGGPATGSWVFARGVGPNAVLNADSWVGQTAVVPFVGQPGVSVNGNFAGSLNATSSSKSPNNGDITLSVTGNLAATARVNAGDFVSLSVLGSVLKGATVVGGAAVSLDIGGNLLGSVLAGAWAEDIPSLSGIVRGNVSNATLTSESEIELSILGNVLNSTFSADNFLRVSVGKNVSGSRFHNSEDGGVSMLVGGNFTKSFINACGDDDDLDDISLRLDVGGNLTSSTVQSEENMVVAVNNGNVSKSTLISTERDISLDVGGALRSSKLRAADGIRADVSRDAVGNEVLADGSVYVATDAGNVSGVIQSAGSTLEVIAARSVLKGSSFSSGADTRIDVGGNFDASTTSRSLRFFVDGNVSKASRIVAQQVTDWQGAPWPGRTSGSAAVSTAS